MLAPEDIVGVDLASMPALTFFGISLGAAKEDNYMIRCLAAEAQPYKYPNASGILLGHAPVVYIMCAERTGQYHKRMSVGWVLLEAWVKLQHRFEDIVLL